MKQKSNKSCILVAMLAVSAIFIGSVVVAAAPVANPPIVPGTITSVPTKCTNPTTIPLVKDCAIAVVKENLGVVRSYLGSLYTTITSLVSNVNTLNQTVSGLVANSDKGGSWVWGSAILTKVPDASEYYKFSCGSILDSKCEGSHFSVQLWPLSVFAISMPGAQPPLAHRFEGSPFNYDASIPTSWCKSAELMTVKLLKSVHPQFQSHEQIKLIKGVYCVPSDNPELNDKCFTTTENATCNQ